MKKVLLLLAVLAFMAACENSVKTTEKNDVEKPADTDTLMTDTVTPADTTQKDSDTVLSGDDGTVQPDEDTTATTDEQQTEIDPVSDDFTAPVDDSTVKPDADMPVYSSLTYNFSDSRSYQLSGKATIRYGGAKDTIFSNPSQFESTKSTIEVTFDQGVSIPEERSYVRVSIFRSGVNLSACSMQKPCVVNLGQNNHVAVWERQNMSGSIITEGEITGDIRITSFIDYSSSTPSGAMLYFSGDKLIFTPTN